MKLGFFSRKPQGMVYRGHSLLSTSKSLDPQRRPMAWLLLWLWAAHGLKAGSDPREIAGDWC